MSIMGLKYYNYLKDNGYDTEFGRVVGNGEYWVEFIVAKEPPRPERGKIGD